MRAPKNESQFVSAAALRIMSHYTLVYHACIMYNERGASRVYEIFFKKYFLKIFSYIKLSTRMCIYHTCCVHMVR